MEYIKRRQRYNAAIRIYHLRAGGRIKLTRDLNTPSVLDSLCC